ncbi:2-oxoglutarate ferredoxin oxidoreductase subunit alpha [Fervidicella metallireducens AeB]|uniref:2-oxoglutarate ferredoxin oxidoreductase subunit alpha n=1 Tax=Fervidicella metallireducens AeB TaxID=1403537 RepID=A0A017RVF7_9CLOT|nr:2-oxoacid:acceptor oxidoreductase subunit alpha [Fervidicella metallireducens]EYE88399.1 2-oxoglutarate ferredoxin oxidoreductase subunit alpha [Fervidicella metallireducens AeB]
MSKRLLMQGNTACVEGALRAGMRFFAGYPITPSTEIAELLSIKLPKVNGKFIQMEDEISSMAAIIGASLCGLKSMTATSGPGFSLKQENIGYAAMTEVPCVIVNVMRGGPSTGLPTCVSQSDVMQSRWGTHGDHPIIVIAPVTVKDIYYMTIKAFNYAEAFRVPVVLLLDEVIAHMRECVELDEEIQIVNRKRPATKESYLPYRNEDDGVPHMADFGMGYKYHVTGLVHNEKGYPTSNPDITEKLITRLHKKIEDKASEIVLFDALNITNGGDLLISYGSSARVCKEIIFNEKVRGIGLFIPYTLWPFPEEQLIKLIKDNNIRRIFVAELNTGQLLLEIRRIVGNTCRVIGINKYNGELFTPEDITKKIEEAIE